MTPPMTAPRLGEELPDGSSSSEELLIASVEELCVMSAVLDAVSLDLTVDVCDVSPVLNSLDSDVVVMSIVGVI